MTNEKKSLNEILVKKFIEKFKNNMPIFRIFYKDCLDCINEESLINNRELTISEFISEDFYIIPSSLFEKFKENHGLSDSSIIYLLEFEINGLETNDTIIASLVVSKDLDVMFLEVYNESIDLTIFDLEFNFK